MVCNRNSDIETSLKDQREGRSSIYGSSHIEHWNRSSMNFLVFEEDETHELERVMSLINNPKRKIHFPWDDETRTEPKALSAPVNGIDGPSFMAAKITSQSFDKRHLTAEVPINNNVTAALSSKLNVDAAVFTPGVTPGAKYLSHPESVLVEQSQSVELPTGVKDTQAIKNRFCENPSSANLARSAISNSVVKSSDESASVAPTRQETEIRNGCDEASTTLQFGEVEFGKLIDLEAKSAIRITSGKAQHVPAFVSIQDNSHSHITSLKAVFSASSEMNGSQCQKASVLRSSTEHETVVININATVHPQVEISNKLSTEKQLSQEEQSQVTTLSNTPVINTAPKTPKNWAALFEPKNSASVPIVSTTSLQSPTTESKTEKKPPVNELGDILSKVVLHTTATSLQARGLINQANWCYINATLQALIACPPFYQFLKGLPRYPVLSRNGSITPVLDAMIEFANEFVELPPERIRKDKGNKKWNAELKKGDSFEPQSIYKILPVMKTAANTFQHGKQEDAEEFLACLLNTLHEEMCAAITANQKDDKDIDSDEAGTDHDDGEWEQVGPRNKSVVTHSNVGAVVSPISRIFGGKMRSLLYTTKESATLEPFFTVPLNVQTCKSIPEALQFFVGKEDIDGYTCPQSKKQLDAWRRLMFEELPKILILHLKCFVYNKQGGSKKVMHNSTFNETLTFDKDLLSAQARAMHSLSNQRTYKLFAVVYHSGEKTTGGHYHTNVFHTGIRNWVKFDDYGISPVSLKDVFNSQPPCVPYLLYYKRVDMMPQHHSQSR